MRQIENHWLFKIVKTQEFMYKTLFCGQNSSADAFLIHLLTPPRGKEERIPRKVNISELEGKNW